MNRGSLDQNKTMSQDGGSRGPKVVRSSVSMGQLLRSYWFDYLVIICLLALWIGTSYIHPYQRYIYEVELTHWLAYPHIGDTIPAWSVPLYSLLLPALVFILFACLYRSFHDFHQALVGLLFTVFAVGTLTNLTKNTVGRPRPDFGAICFLNGQPLFALNGNVICNNPLSTAADYRDARQSFFSGHSSISAAGLGYLSFYLAGKLHIFDLRGHLSKLVPVLVPSLLAIWVGYTRSMNYKHHPSDIVVGLLVGFGMAYLVYRQHYPRFSDPETLCERRVPRNFTASLSSSIKSWRIADATLHDVWALKSENLHVNLQSHAGAEQPLQKAKAVY